MAWIKTSIAYTTKDGAKVAVGAIQLESGEQAGNCIVRGDNIVGKFDDSKQIVIGNGGNRSNNNCNSK